MFSFLFFFVRNLALTNKNGNRKQLLYEKKKFKLILLTIEWCFKTYFSRNKKINLHNKTLGSKREKNTEAKNKMVNSISSSSSISRSKKVTSSRNSIAKEEDPDAVILTGSEGESLSPIVNPVGRFARLKYGDNQELLFNIECQVWDILSTKKKILKFFL